MGRTRTEIGCGSEAWIGGKGGCRMGDRGGGRGADEGMKRG